MLRLLLILCGRLLTDRILLTTTVLPWIAGFTMWHLWLCKVLTRFRRLWRPNADVLVMSILNGVDLRSSSDAVGWGCTHRVKFGTSALDVSGSR